MYVWCNKIVAPSLFSHRRPLFKHITTSAAIPSSNTSRKARAINGSEKPSVTGPLLPSPNLPALSCSQKDQITLYVSALLEWNLRMNLTAVTQESEVMTRHVEDSLALVPPLQRSYRSRCCTSDDDDDGLSLVDVGSGPGLPGLILAIACPSWKVTLLESMQKRCLFLEHVVDLVGLSNVEIIRERAEDRMQASVLISESYLMWRWHELLQK